MKRKEKIFIRKLPTGTSRKDLIQFINQGLKSSLFGLSFLPHDEIEECHIIKIVDKNAGTVEHHGIAEIWPGGDIDDVIKRLNGKTLRRRPLEVHRYQLRSPHNERRNPLLLSDEASNNERRDNDRRRPHLFIQKESGPRVVGMESFARTYG
ncbi:MAG: hypothetical protein ABW168_05475 [Sedimenticola sp.]